MAFRVSLSIVWFYYLFLFYNVFVKILKNLLVFCQNNVTFL